MLELWYRSNQKRNIISLRTSLCSSPKLSRGKSLAWTSKTFFTYCQCIGAMMLLNSSETVIIVQMISSTISSLFCFLEQLSIINDVWWSLASLRTYTLVVKLVGFVYCVSYDQMCFRIKEKHFPISILWYFFLWKFKSSTELLTMYLVNAPFSNKLHIQHFIT